VIVQNNSCGSGLGLLRVAASSNLPFEEIKSLWQRLYGKPRNPAPD
jgi:hypothetical protein